MLLAFVTSCIAGAPDDRPCCPSCAYLDGCTWRTDPSETDAVDATAHATSREIVVEFVGEDGEKYRVIFDRPGCEGEE